MVDLAQSRVPLVVVPVLAVAALALGLRVGAREDFKVAVVYAAPPAKGSSVLAWQLMTLEQERGVEQTLPMHVHVTATARGQTVTTETTTNDDGIAEISLPFASLGPSDSIVMSVRDDAGALLAEGSTTMTSPTREAPREQWVRASKLEGRIGLGLTVRGGRLVPGFPVRAYVRAVDNQGARPLSGVELHAQSDMAIDASSASPTCSTGWAPLDLTARAHVADLTITARNKTDEGSWYGAVPIAAGALGVDVAERAPPGPLTFTVTAPGAQSTAYVEVDDAEGRAFAQVVDLSGPAKSGPPMARVTTPPLAPGLHWVVASGEPKGATTMNGATIALPVRVGATETECATGSDASLVASGFPRWPAIDGRDHARALAAERRKKGLSLALGSFAVAAALETLLIAMASRGAKRGMARVADEAGAPDIAPPARQRWLDVTVALLLFLLVLGLLAAFMTWRFE